MDSGKLDLSHSLILIHLIFPVKPGSVGSRRAACTEMPHLFPWMGSTSLSPVQTTVGDMEIASLESASVIWDTQVQWYIVKEKGWNWRGKSIEKSSDSLFFSIVEQDSCVPSVASPQELTEGFEGKLSPLWQSLSGGQIGGGCGIIGEGKALYFSSPGRREAHTVPLDTTNTR